MISLIDTHAHYNSKSLSNVQEEIRKANENNKVSKIVNGGLDYETSKEAILIANGNDKFYASIGIHPFYEGEVSSLEYLYNAFDSGKVVALGEIGLDDTRTLYHQLDKFIESIKIANKLHLPLIIHVNDTHNDKSMSRICLAILKKYHPKCSFVLHCFQPDLDILKEIIKLGGYISIANKITQVNAKKSLEVVRQVPLNRLLIETDYPFLTLDPEFDGINTFNKICELKSISRQDMMIHLNGNAKRLFYNLSK